MMPNDAAPFNAEGTPARQPLLAPLWHTALIVALTASASIAGARGVTHPIHATPVAKLHSYLASIVLEWGLAAVVLWGLHLRRTPWRDVLGVRTSGHSALSAWLRDAGAAAVFWIVALMVLGTVAAMLRAFHLHPENIRAAVSSLAPYSLADVLAWTALSISAGICEEFIFRGYLQQQCARLGHRAWIGVVASALLFGFAHGYEGWSGMLLITAFGALFGVLRLLRGNLRAGIVAHGWHDFFSGMVLSFLAHHPHLAVA